jgi:hypothetical protein
VIQREAEWEAELVEFAAGDLVDLPGPFWDTVTKKKNLPAKYRPRNHLKWKSQISSWGLTEVLEAHRSEKLSIHQTSRVRQCMDHSNQLKES